MSNCCSSSSLQFRGYRLSIFSLMRVLVSRKTEGRSKRTTPNLSLFLTTIVSAGFARRPLGRRELATCPSRIPKEPFTCRATDWEATPMSDGRCFFLKEYFINASSLTVSYWIHCTNQPAESETKI